MSRPPKKSGKKKARGKKTAPKMHFSHTQTHFRVHSLKKGVSENEAPGPIDAYTTTHNNTPTQMPDRESKLLTATFDQECSFCREETVCDMPSRETIGFDPCVFQQRCRSVIKLSIQPPRVHLAVGVPAVMSPQDTIEHTHLRGPRKAHTYIGR